MRTRMVSNASLFSRALQAIAVRALHFYAVLLFACATILFPHPKPVLAEEMPVTLSWPFFSLPPLFIQDQSGKSGGFGPEIMALIQKGLPDFTHTSQIAPPERMLLEAQKNKSIVLTGLLKTPEREKYLVYTALPCRLMFNMRLIIRRADMERIAPKGIASFTALLDDHDLTGGFAAELFHGKFQPLIDEHHDRATFLPVQGSTPLRQLMDMLRLGRIDWFLFDPLTVKHVVEAMDLSGSVASIPCIEAPAEVFAGYLACPNTSWGRALVKRMDAILAEEILSGQLRSLLAPWIPGELMNEFEVGYRRLMLLPARELTAAGPSAVFQD